MNDSRLQPGKLYIPGDGADWFAFLLYAPGEVNNYVDISYWWNDNRVCVSFTDEAHLTQIDGFY